ncbi:chromate efflux transporter [Rhodopila sp.]|uniref:chromate efflux transporter n=1 Tax=Rhodopila sp. TaxID=2480087 RepID=UPI003D0D8EF9
MTRVLEVFVVFLRLGCTSFGGPIAHLGYFRAELVTKRRWLTEASFADIVAMCQFMPGPASSQTGMAIGLIRGGPVGMLAAWFGFTLPSAVAMTLFGYGVGEIGNLAQAGWLRGLKLVAVAVVAQAVWGMARSLAPDRARASVAVAACLICLAIPSSFGQIAAIVLGAVIGAALPGKPPGIEQPVRLGVRIPKAIAVSLLLAFLVLLLGLPLLAEDTGSQGLRLVDAFYRAGSLVFGGGHVVLPLLQATVVRPGWVGQDVFLAGYGATQAVPGPVFSFAAFLGAVETPGPNGWAGALIATMSIFASSFLLVGGLLPFWDTLRHRAGVRAALRGVNAAVVGVLLAALFTPIWTGAVHTSADFGLGLVAFLLLTLWAVPPWLVVPLGALGGWGLGLMGQT